MTHGATIALGGAGGRSLTLALPPGDVGTDASIMAMRACAEDGAENSRRVAQLAATLGSGQMVVNLYDWCRAHVRFRRDRPGFEHVRHPDQVLAEIERDGIAQVDCDCLATLACAVLKRWGAGAAFITVSREAAPAPFEHVLWATGAWRNLPWKLPDNVKPPSLVPADPQERVPLGALPEGVRRFRVYPF